MVPERITISIKGGRILYVGLPSSEYKDTDCSMALNSLQLTISREATRGKGDVSEEVEDLLECGFQKGQIAVLLGALRMEYDLEGSFTYIHDAESGKKISDIQLRTRS